MTALKHLGSKDSSTSPLSQSAGVFFVSSTCKACCLDDNIFFFKGKIKSVFMYYSRFVASLYLNCFS